MEKWAQALPIIHSQNIKLIILLIFISDMWIRF
jgi:hypothetical protein